MHRALQVGLEPEEAPLIPLARQPILASSPLGVSHLVVVAAGDETQRFDQILDLIGLAAVGQHPYATAAPCWFSHVGADEPPVQHVARVRHPALHAVPVLLGVLGKTVDRLLHRTINPALLGAGDDLQHPVDVPFGERNAALPFNKLVNIFCQLAGCELSWEKFIKYMLPSSLLQVFPEAISRYGGTFNRHLHSQLFPKESV